MPELDVDVLFHDHGILVIDKPAGLAMQAGVDVLHEDSLIGAVQAEFEVEPEFTPSALGRLDRGTSGVVVLALSRNALRGLEPAWRDGRVHKDYLVVVHGKTDERGVIDIELAARRPRKKGTGAKESARTSYRRVAVDGNRASVVAARIHTGRTHQIRRHMKAIGHPVVGDDRYGHAARDADLPAHTGLMLHAARVSHVGDVESLPLSVLAPVPARMAELARALGLTFGPLPDAI